jgi:hypothetical protein
MLSPLDGPSSQTLLSVTSTTAIIAKAGASAFPERKVLTLQPLDGKIRVFFANEGVTPTLSDVLTKGFKHPKTAMRSYEASDQQVVYIVAETGTVNVVIAERA